MGSKGVAEPEKHDDVTQLSGLQTGQGAGRLSVACL